MTRVVIIGGGPAGLMAAEAAIAQGVDVELYDSMPSVGRKFLLAGKGGLNLTHSEPIEPFLSRYGERRKCLASSITAFSPQKIRDWAHDLGVETFVGTSGRIFPIDLKAAPLLRAWLRRLRQAGVRFCVHHRWCGWDERDRLHFRTPERMISVEAEAVVLALGGGSWPKFGSDAAWVRILAERNVPITSLKPANCGFDVQWSDYFRRKFAGSPVKTVEIIVSTNDGLLLRRKGEFVITETGVEGGAIYAVSRYLRDGIEKNGTATLSLDLVPDRSLRRLTEDLSRPRGKRTMATHLKRCAGLGGVKAGLLRETVGTDVWGDPIRLAQAIKALPIVLVCPRPLEEAISTAGGISFEGLDENLMLQSLPGVFCAGEMLDWEAPTGGYLLTACLATGRLAGNAATQWSKSQAAQEIQMPSAKKNDGKL